MKNIYFYLNVLVASKLKVNLCSKELMNTQTIIFPCINLLNSQVGIKKKFFFIGKIFVLCTIYSLINQN